MGWAFKKDTNDTRETAAMYVADILMNDLANICAFDPKVSQEQMYADMDYLNSRTEAENREQLKAAATPYDAVKDAHAIAVLTEWDEFLSYDWKKIFDTMMKPAFVFDGRNILNHKKLREIGFVVSAIGK